ncbi:hypothetical protein PUR71_39050 [Streptomyces sp. SP17BM10]|uniref:hypothetical protein n=1 Tax=Streptomyces sp. SP17BM10 TaxID=3002530 RepID=UPI002E77214F|nr:hypothetical protein [Streptomyces sp. SP17BM10]MEE1788858.1 hypothetical protein [Streptomyces sp. SP17BM10]
MSAHAAPTAVLPPAVPRTPGEAVDLLAAREATGALRGPLGSVYLTDGLVTHAESDRAPDLGDLLTGCGRLAPGEWRELVEVHGPQARVAAALVERGRITRGELELGHLETLFDAAFFVLADTGGGLWRFETGARHWLGPVSAVDAARVCRESERRRRLLDGIWPWAQLDTAPVRPAEATRRPSRRPPGRRRRELLDHADGRRTPAELARLLGRSGFGVTADVRRLAAAGLLDPAPAVVPGPVSVPGPAAVAAQAPTAVPAQPPPAPGQASAPAPVPIPVSEIPRSPGLHRRVPGATLTSAGVPGAVAPGPRPFGAHAAGAPGHGAPAPGAAPRSDRQPIPAAAHPLTVPDPDVALLTRVLTLLEARL